MGERMILAAAWITFKPYEWARRLPEHTPIRFFAELGSVALAVLTWPLTIPLLLVGWMIASAEEFLNSLK